VVQSPPLLTQLQQLLGGGLCHDLANTSETPRTKPSMAYRTTKGVDSTLSCPMVNGSTSGKPPLLSMKPGNVTRPCSIRSHGSSLQ